MLSTLTRGRFLKTKLYELELLKRLRLPDGLLYYIREVLFRKLRALNKGPLCERENV